MKLRPTVIAFEGPDGVGKTTLSRMLCARMTELGYDVELYSFPGRGCSDLGNLVYDFHHKAVKGEASVDRLSLQLLHAAAHIDLINNKVNPALKKGHCVILDRFWWSLVAYGLCDNVSPEALNSVLDLERMFLKTIEPVIVFLVKRAVQEQQYSSLMQQYLRIYAEQKDQGNSFLLLNDNLCLTLKTLENTLFNL